jgi:hypothetical protein
VKRSVSTNKKCNSNQNCLIFLRERVNLEDPGVDVRIILKWIFSKWDVGGMDWIDVAQGRDSWWALVNAVMKFRFP